MTFLKFLDDMGIPNVSRECLISLKAFFDANYEILAQECSLEDFSDSNYDLIGLVTCLVAIGYDFSTVKGVDTFAARSLFEWVENKLVDPIRLHLDEEDPACDIIRLLNTLCFKDKRA